MNTMICHLDNKYFQMCYDHSYRFSKFKVVIDCEIMLSTANLIGTRIVLALEHLALRRSLPHLLS